MPFLDIATTQPCVRNNVCSVSSRTFFGTRLVHTKEIRFVSSWNTFRVPSKAPNSRIKLFRNGLRIMAVATLKKGPTKNTKSNEEQNDFGGVRMAKYSNSDVEQQSSSEEAEDLDEREKLRRMRISKANKGNKPWNLGRKHSPETLRRIRERTRLAMQDPKVKMKLANLGHAQSEETRMKIGAGVRMGWEKRRGAMRLQETCYYEWQNLIAEASRRGSQGEEELQWDSYEILSEQLEQEWLRSVEERKHMPRPKGGKRAPKSVEQRKKISEAIAAKWADPAYRSRVRSGLEKHHAVVGGVERKPRRKPVGDGQTRKRSTPKRKADVMDMFAKPKPKPKSQVQRYRLRRKYTPMYKDPLASSKLEMLKNIRAQRAAIDREKIEAITRAREMIAEAQKAADALEMAAQTSPVAQASLIETRKLIHEAIQSIKSIEKEVGFTDGNDATLSPPSAELESNEAIQSIKSVEKEVGFTDANDATLSPPSAELESHAADERDSELGPPGYPGERINGWHALTPMDRRSYNLEHGQHALQGPVNGKSVDFLSGLGEDDLLGDRHEVYQMISTEISSETGVDITQQPSTSTQILNEDEASESPGDEQEPLPNGLIYGSTIKETPTQPPPTTAISRAEIEEAPTLPPTTTGKKWVCGRLVEVGEEF